MKNHPISTRLSVVLFLGLAGAAAPGCGGPGGGGGGGGGGTSGDEAVVTEAGTAITQAAQDRWGDALRAYNAALPEGMTPEECTSVIHSFEEANSTQGGSFTEAIYMMGVTHERCGHADQAREFYSRALQMNDHFCGARVAAGIEHYRAGRVDQARGEFERSVRDDTRCTEGYVNLAIIQRRNPAQAADALNNLRRALAIDSNYLPAFNQMALLYLEQAVRQAGGQATVQGGVAAQTTAEGEGASDHHTTASQRTSSQMLDLAEVVCRQAQLIDGNYAPIYNTWGLINVQQGNIIAALAKFERAFQLDASLFEAYMNFGELTLSFRGYDDAAAAFTRATELRATSYDAFIGLGAAKRGLQDPDAAQAAYERAIAIDGNRPEAYFNLGLLYQDYRDGTETTLNRAVEYYNQFVSHAGSNPVFAPAVASVTHTCTPICPTPPAERGHSTRRRRRAVTCSMGRIQQIGQNLCLVREMAQMQADIAAMQAQIESQAASQSTETPAPAPDATTPPPQ